MLESCLLSLSQADLESISEKNPAAGRIWKKFRGKIEQPIAVILIINTLAHTIGATVSGSQFTQIYGPKWVFLYSLVFSYVMIQWTEIWPKSWGVFYNRKVANIMALPMQFMVTIMKPIVWWCELMNKPFEKKSKGGHRLDTLNDITLLARFAQYDNLITKEQQDIVSRSMKLANTTVKEIMIEKENIKYLSTNMGMGEALIEAHIHHHTRYPLIRGTDTNKVLGYVNVKDIVSALKMNPKNPTLEGIARPIMLVNQDQLLTDILKKLTSGYQHVAVVQDEKENVTGLITQEDVIEMILGDMQDEYDILPKYANSLCEGRFIVGGGIQMTDLGAKTGLSIPKSDMSLSSWILQKLPHAKVEQKVSENGINYIIRKIKRSQIYEVIVEDPAMTTAVPCPENKI